MDVRPVILVGSYVTTAIGVGLLAHSRGRSLGVWLVVALLITPPLAWLILTLQPELTTPCWNCGHAMRDELTKCPMCAAVKGRGPR